MSRWIDITRPVDENLPCWPGRAPPEHRWEKSLGAGDHCNVSMWRINAHAGTHMDAPLHFFADGKPIDQIPAEIFLGRCEIVDLSSPDAAPFDVDLAKRYCGVERLLIRTAHSAGITRTGYQPHDALMSEAAAAVLIEGGLRLIGTDRLSVDDSAGKGFELHHRFLGADCVIVEGLLLTEVSAGLYQLYAAPLRLTNTEASPVRALCQPETAKP
ncbi:MAG: cyclase family protein [Planctomycetaceae bacterium]|nr:cyclase family protein [Planctomycetaceae bacterium]